MAASALKRLVDSGVDPTSMDATTQAGEPPRDGRPLELTELEDELDDGQVLITVEMEGNRDLGRVRALLDVVGGHSEILN